MTGSTYRNAVSVAALAAAAVCAAATPAAGGDSDLPEIAYTKKVLANGLTVIVHEDHKAPVVGVNIWYHVGSKNERPGRTGFAHLFEHLMFNGSEHADTDWFRGTSEMGATGVNGTTSNDRTNYFETVPKGALDRTLWLESDRMGHLLGAIDQAKLDEQRGVVQNEKRQGENRPYGSVWNRLPPLAYPQGHPYSWSVIGSMEDLDAATVDDVHQWFGAYYGAANAVLVLCGDVETEHALARVEHYFGDIAPGPDITRPEAWVAKRSGTTRISVEERVPQARIHKLWNTPEWGSEDATLLELAASMLARGENSRLYQRLVRADGLATDVVAFQDTAELGSTWHAWATASSGVALADLEAALDEEIARFLADGPTADELATEKIQERASLLRNTERVGGFGGKANLLASSEVFGGSPDAWKNRMSVIAAATPQSVRDAARRWLADGALVIETLPLARFTAADTGADRTTPPVIEPASAARFPTLERATLSNGLQVVLAPRPGSPLVRVDALVDAGSAADPRGGAGTNKLVAWLLRAGTTTRTAEQINVEADRLGAELTVNTDIDVTRVTISSLVETLEPSIALLADVTLHPSFPDGEVEARRKQQLAAIAQEKVEGWGMLNRVLPGVLYGAGHPYGAPWSGNGLADSVSALDANALRAFHSTWFRPGSTTVVVTGDAKMEQLTPLLEKAFAAWKAGKAPAKVLPAAPAAQASRVFLLDRPGAPQTVMVAAQLAPPRGGDAELPFAIMNTVFGGSFVSRLNMNLREDKHWSYGARSRLYQSRGPRIVSAGSSVQTDKTSESLTEILKEVRGIGGAVPPTPEEVTTAKSGMTLTLPGRWEATNAIAESVGEIVTFGLPDTYFDGYADRVQAVTTEQLDTAAAHFHPDHLVWIVIGDLVTIEEGVRALGLGETTVIDPDGNAVTAR